MRNLIRKQLIKLNIYQPGMYSEALNAFNRIKYSVYKGSGFTCNFCNCSYTRFIPQYPTIETKEALAKNHVIAGYGHNVYCPNCMSTNRERLVSCIIQQDLDISGKKILHFSPEKNVYNSIKDKAHVTAVDIMPECFRTFAPAIEYADATKITYPDEQFDFVIANHILEHIPDDMKAMQEIYRVLKRNGMAILQVPYSETLPTTIEEPNINDRKKQEKLFGQADHVRIYSLTNYIQRLKKAGFTVKLLTPESLRNLRKFAIQPEESFFMCYKN